MFTIVYINITLVYAYNFSAGVGRSGTFIAIDYLLKQAEQQQEIDVYGCTSLMRSNRPHMVQKMVKILIYNTMYEFSTY